MKLKHLFFNALAVISFAACSSEAEEIKPAEKASTATLQLDMTGQYGTGNSDQTRALSLDGTEYPRFIHEEGVTDWSTHCFIRNEAGDVQFYALVDWNATTDSDGNISLHIKNSTLTLQNSAGSDVTATETLPKAGERWYIAGIAGGGVLDATKSNVNFAYNAALDGNLKSNQARIPLAFGWTPFTIPSNTQRAPRIVVQFKPQGTLLSVYVNNKTNVNQIPLKSLVKVRSNALSQDGLFDYSLAATRTDYTAAPKWTFTSEDATTSTIYQHVSIDANAGANCYVWAMPRPESSKPATGFKTKIGVSAHKVFAADTQNEPTTETTTFVAARSYPRTVDVSAPRMPYEYLTEYNVAPDGQSFVDTHANNVSGYWNWADAVANFSSITINNSDFHLPMNTECRGISPSWNTELSRVRFDNATSEDNVQEAINIDGYTNTYYSDYRGTTSGTAYAIRFRNSSDNSRLTACRWQYTTNSTGGRILKVTYRHLGIAGQATTVEQVATDEYWNTNADNDVVFYFPAAGRYNTDALLIEVGNIGFYWNRASISSDIGGIFYFNGGTSYGGSLEKSYKFAIRLFKSDVF